MRVTGIQVAWRASVGRDEEKVRPLLAGEHVPVTGEQVGK